MMLDVANEHSDGRLVSMLEGGYNLSGLAKAVEHHFRALIKLRAIHSNSTIALITPFRAVIRSNWLTFIKSTTVRDEIFGVNLTSSDRFDNIA